MKVSINLSLNCGNLGGTSLTGWTLDMRQPRNPRKEVQRVLQYSAVETIGKDQSRQTGVRKRGTGVSVSFHVRCLRELP